VDAEDGLTEGWVISFGTEGLHQRASLDG
jgi:hypothetical protein